MGTWGAGTVSPEVLVLGSAGFLGLHTVDALRSLGVEPRCGRRARSNVLGLRSRKARMVQVDLNAPETLAAAMEGCDAVVHLAGHYPRTSLDPQGAMALGLDQTRAVLDAAALAGVDRLVYVSSTATVAPAPAAPGAPAPPSDERHRFTAPPGLGTYHDLKWAMEELVRVEDRLSTVIACPAACLGPGDLRVGTSALLVGTARGLPVPHPDGLVSFVDARDVGYALARLALDPHPPARLLLSAATVSLQALLEGLAGRYGVAAPSPALSVDEALALADEGERAWVAGGDRPLLAREIADLVIHGLCLDGGLAVRWLGRPYTPLSTTLDDFDAWARRLGFVPPQPEAAPCPNSTSPPPPSSPPWTTTPGGSSGSSPS